MFNVRILTLVALSSFLLSGVGTANSRQTQNATGPGNRDVPEMKVLFSGAHCAVSNSFIAVARDPDTYAAISKLAENMPKLDDEFFKTNVVVAAFLGQRRTGGYGVEFGRGDKDEIRVSEKAPGKNAMVTQVLTTPFKVVAVPIQDDAPLHITVDAAWRDAMQTYRVTSGKFTMSGGFAGRSENFQLNGEVGVMREGKLATFALSLYNISATKERSLTDLVTGVVDDSAFKIQKLSRGSLVDPPGSALRAVGTFNDQLRRLALTFVSLPSMVADGYSGAGSIEAEASGPSSKPRELG